MGHIDQTIQDQMTRMKGRNLFKPFRILKKDGGSYLVMDSMQYAFTDYLVAYVVKTEDRIIHIPADEFAGIQFVDEKPAA